MKCLRVLSLIDELSTWVGLILKYQLTLCLNLLMKNGSSYLRCWATLKSPERKDIKCCQFSITILLSRELKCCSTSSKNKRRGEEEASNPSFGCLFTFVIQTIKFSSYRDLSTWKQFSSDVEIHDGISSLSRAIPHHRTNPLLKLIFVRMFHFSQSVC